MGKIRRSQSISRYKRDKDKLGHARPTVLTTKNKHDKDETGSGSTQCSHRNRRNHSSSSSSLDSRSMSSRTSSRKRGTLALVLQQCHHLRIRMLKPEAASMDSFEPKDATAPPIFVKKHTRSRVRVESPKLALLTQVQMRQLLGEIKPIVHWQTAGSSFGPMQTNYPKPAFVS